MADIDIACAACGKTLVVSEYASLDKMTCQACGASLKDAKPPEGSAKPDGKPGLKFKQAAAPQEIDTGADTPGKHAPPAPEPSSFNTLVAAIRKPKKRKRSINYLLSWLLFLVLGGAMGYLRYGNVLGNQHIAWLTEAAPWAVLGMHLLILSAAFKDNIFTGVLCLLIPGYSFVYILFIADGFFMRATIAGLLIGLAQDAWVVYYELASATIVAIRDWIASGGGELRY